MRSDAHIDRAANPVQLWNAKVRSYVSLRAEKALVRHSDLYNPQALQRALAPLLKLLQNSTTKTSAIELPGLIADGENDKWSGAFTKTAFDQAQEYDATRRWLELYTQEDLNFVNAQLDVKLMREFDIPIVRSVDDMVSLASPKLELSVHTVGETHHRRQLSTGGVRQASNARTTLSIALTQKEHQVHLNFLEALQIQRHERS
jgi:hypothetical protein